MNGARYLLRLPQGYKKVPMPGLNAWVAALRSGEYKQSKEHLRDSDGCYCCLGVLCHLQGRLDVRGLDDGKTSGGLAENNPLFPLLNNSGMLPPHVSVSHGGVSMRRLSFLNDVSNGLTFDEIADVLEAVYENEPSTWEVAR